MRPLFQFIRDLALIPSLWRSAVAAERYRRFRRSPEGLASLAEQESRRVEQKIRATGELLRILNPAYKARRVNAGEEG